MLWTTWSCSKCGGPPGWMLGYTPSTFVCPYEVLIVTSKSSIAKTPRRSRHFSTRARRRRIRAACVCPCLDSSCLENEKQAPSRRGDARACLGDLDLASPSKSGPRPGSREVAGMNGTCARPLNRPPSHGDGLVHPVAKPRIGLS